MNEVNRIPRLSKRDAEILDTIAEGGFDPARIEELQGEVPGKAQRRARRAHGRAHEEGEANEDDDPSATQ